jgi:hypothetical protein
MDPGYVCALQLLEDEINDDIVSLKMLCDDVMYNTGSSIFEKIDVASLAKFIDVQVAQLIPPPEDGDDDNTDDECEDYIPHEKF